MNKTCKRCGTTYQISYFYKNPKVAGGRLHQCKFCVVKVRRKYRENNLEKVKLKRKDIYYRDRQKNIEDATKWGKDNPVNRKIARAKWRAANKELANHMTKDWYPRKMGAKGSYTLEEFKIKLALFGGKCAYCKVNEATTRDHIVPISKGGTNTIDNINPSCLGCNDSKGAKLLSQWK